MNKLAKHPNILNSHYFNPDGYMKNGGKKEKVQYLLLDVAENGPISRYVRICGEIEEDLTKFMFLQLTDALRFIHASGYVHLDLKLENILVDKFYNIKLADMGVAFELDSNTNFWNLRRGTLHYMAPEVMDLKKGDNYDAVKADIFSLGIWLYIMLVGDFPNYKMLTKTLTSTDESSIDMMVDGDCLDDEKSTKNWNNLSDSVRELLLSMMAKYPEDRPSTEQIMCHEWLSDANYELIQSDLYAEMSHRKKFISTFPSRKHKLSK